MANTYLIWPQKGKILKRVFIVYPELNKNKFLNVEWKKSSKITIIPLNGTLNSTRRNLLSLF